MQYAICNETFVDWPFDRAFAVARECGYTGIEFAPFTMGPDATSISAARRGEVRAQLASAGLEAVGLHWLLARTQGYYLTSPDAAVRGRTSAYLGELARLCAELGGKIMVLGSPQQRNLLPGVTHAAGMDYAADVLRGVCPTLEKLGVTIAVEPLGPQEGDFLQTAAAGVELVGKVSSPQVRLHLDVKAMSSEPFAVADTIRRFAPWMVHFHSNDPNRRGPGMGEMDFVPIFQALNDVGYAGWVSVEVFEYEYPTGLEGLAADSISYMRRCNAALGRELPK
ncbi:MAG: sugar phosphate isomerase/epimerase [Planctomycetes bacterium]|nr:sugar phosphate isomerase/epimerase [Planctomycetota bacterium]